GDQPGRRADEEPDRRGGDVRIREPNGCGIGSRRGPDRCIEAALLHHGAELASEARECQARSVPKLGRALRRSAIEAKEPAEPLAALDPTASSASPDESMRPLQTPCQVLRLDQSPGHPVWPKHDRVSPPLSGPAVAARLLVSVHVLASLPVQVAKQDLRCRVGFTDAWCTI